MDTLTPLELIVRFESFFCSPYMYAWAGVTECGVRPANGAEAMLTFPAATATAVSNLGDLSAAHRDHSGEVRAT